MRRLKIGCTLSTLALVLATAVTAIAGTAPHAVTAVAGTAPDAVRFEASCTLESDYGWPRFNNAEELQADQRWARYVKRVYGALPHKYPVCVFDFWHLDEEAYELAGLNGSRTIVTDLKALREGDLYRQAGLGIYHNEWTPAPNNSWVEVTHMVLPSELEGMWVWRQRGSGIFANVGRTIVFPTPAQMSKTHAEAIQFLTDGCSKKPSAAWPQFESDIFGFCAREKGYDSVQFAPTDGAVPLSSFGLIGRTEMVLTHLDGRLTCGVENASATTLRQGWRAASRCNCANEPIPPACGLMPYPPFPYSLFGEAPRLCELRERSRFAKCQPMACRPTRCKVGATSSHVHRPR